MLVFTRKVGQRTLVGKSWVTVLAVKGNQIRLGIEAPDDVDVMREEAIPSTPNAALADELDLVEV